MEAQKFRALVREIFDAHYETGLYTPKFYLLDHILKDLDVVERLELLYSSTFGRFDVHNKRVY